MTLLDHQPDIVALPPLPHSPIGGTGSTGRGGPDVRMGPDSGVEPDYCGLSDAQWGPSRSNVACSPGKPDVPVGGGSEGPNPSGEQQCLLPRGGWRQLGVSHNRKIREGNQAPGQSNTTSSDIQGTAIAPPETNRTADRATPSIEDGTLTTTEREKLAYRDTRRLQHPVFPGGHPFNY